MRRLGVPPRPARPDHFAAAVADDQQYVIDIPAGEILAELVKEKPRWQLVYLPPLDQAPEPAQPPEQP